MVVIHENNSLLALRDLNKELENAVFKHFSYFNPDYAFAGKYARTKIPKYIHLYDKQTKTLPTGLLANIKSFFDSRGINYTVEDRRIKPKTSRIYRLHKPLPPLRQYQKDCVEVALQKERGTLHLFTGAGKSIIILALVHSLKLDVLIVVPSRHLLHQLTKSFVHYFSKRPVGGVGDEKRITICTYHSLSSRPKSYFKRFNLLIIDEGHRSACETIFQLNKSKLSAIYYRFFLSATPYRNDGHQLKLDAVIGDTIFEYGVEQGIVDGWLTKPIFIMYPVRNLNHNKNKSKQYSQEYESLVADNRERNDLIASIALKLFKQNKSILVLVKQIGHGTQLKEKIGKCCEFIYSDTPKGNKENDKILEDFNKGRVKVLIATSIVGEGVDLPCAQVLINARGGNKKGNILQNIGRVLRLYPDKKYALIIDFFDGNSKWLIEHSKTRLEIYRKLGEVKVQQMV